MAEIKHNESSTDYIVQQGDGLKEKVNLLAAMILNSFSWADTPQGADYWEEVHSVLTDLAEGKEKKVANEKADNHIEVHYR